MIVSTAISLTIHFTRQAEFDRNLTDTDHVYLQDGRDYCQ